jgi:hypothetical protein
LEGNQNVSNILINHYKTRNDPVHKCFLAAEKLGYKMFGVQDNGMCVSSEDAQFKYSKFGTSTACIDGKGGPLANDIYRISQKTKQSSVQENYVTDDDLCQRKTLCNFDNVTGLAMIDGSGMPGGPGIEPDFKPIRGLPWGACKSFCKSNEECNSFIYCPSISETNEGNPTYTCFLKSTIVTENINMTPSRCFTSIKKCKSVNL